MNEAQSLFKISDVTSREALQALHPKYLDRAVVFPEAVSMRMVEYNMQIGTHVVEFGAPIRSPAKRRLLQRVVDEVNLHNATGGHLEVAAHCRCVIDDINEALEVGVRRLHLFLGTSDELRNGNGRLSEEQIIEKAQSAIRYLRSQPIGNQLTIRFSAEDASSTPIERLVKVFSAVAEDLDVIGLPNTSGLGELDEMVDTAVQLSEVLPGHLAFQFHDHNDRGIAAYSYYAKWKQLRRLGRDVIFDVSTLRLGERNGIPDLVDVIAAFPDKLQGELRRMFNFESISELRRFVADYLEIVPSYLFPLDHLNNILPISGVHYSAEIKNPGAYHRRTFVEHTGKAPIVVASAVVGGKQIQDWCALPEVGLGSIDLATATGIADRCREFAVTQGSIDNDDVYRIASQMIFALEREIVA